MISTCQSHLLARIRAAAAAAAAPLVTESGSVMKSGSALIAITPQLSAREEAPLLSSRFALSPGSLEAGGRSPSLASCPFWRHVSTAEGDGGVALAGDPI